MARLLCFCLGVKGRECFRSRKDTLSESDRASLSFRTPRLARIFCILLAGGGEVLLIAVGSTSADQIIRVRHLMCGHTRGGSSCRRACSGRNLTRGSHAEHGRDSQNHGVGSGRRHSRDGQDVDLGVPRKHDGEVMMARSPRGTKAVLCGVLCGEIGRAHKGESIHRGTVCAEL